MVYKYNESQDVIEIRTIDARKGEGISKAGAECRMGESIVIQFNTAPSYGDMRFSLCRRAAIRAF